MQQEASWPGRRQIPNPGIPDPSAKAVEWPLPEHTMSGWVHRAVLGVPGADVTPPAVGAFPRHKDRVVTAYLHHWPGFLGSLAGHPPPQALPIGSLGRLPSDSSPTHPGAAQEGAPALAETLPQSPGAQMGNMTGALAQPPSEPGQEPHSLLLGSTHRKSNLAPLPCPAHDLTSPTPPHQQVTFQSRGRGAALPTTPSAPGLALANVRSPEFTSSQV